MKVKNEILSFNIEDLELKSSEIAGLMAYDPNEVPELIQQIINSELDGFKNLNDIQGGYKIFEAQSEPEDYKLIVEGKAFHVGEILWKEFKDAEYMAVFICTAGEEISSRSKSLMAGGDLLEGYVVDVIGTIAVENAMDKIAAHLKDKMAEIHLNTSNRYSPGYCAWDVAEQHQLFSLFPEKYCKVELNESALMSPIKSVSGFIAIGKDIKFHNYTCNICTQVNCIYSHRKHRKYL